MALLYGESYFIFIIFVSTVNLGLALLEEDSASLYQPLHYGSMSTERLQYVDEPVYENFGKSAQESNNQYFGSAGQQGFGTFYSPKSQENTSSQQRTFPLLNENVTHALNEVLRAFGLTDQPESRSEISSEDIPRHHLYTEPVNHFNTYGFGHASNLHPVYPYVPYKPILPKPVVVNPILPINPKPVIVKPAVPVHPIVPAHNVNPALPDMTSQLTSLLNLGKVLLGQKTLTTLGYGLMTKFLSGKSGVKGLMAKLLLPIVVLVLVNLEILGLTWWLWKDECAKLVEHSSSDDFDFKMNKYKMTEDFYPYYKSAPFNAQPSIRF